LPRGFPFPARTQGRCLDRRARIEKLIEPRTGKPMAGSLPARPERLSGPGL